MRTTGNCDTGYSCAYTNSLAWRTPTTPLPPENNPRAVFERLFGSLDTNLNPAARAELTMERKSVLDYVNERTAKLVGKLGPADRHKIDEYLFVMDPVFWTGSLSERAALKMKENQCHELARTTHRA
jgi:hypothetical protein